MDIYDHFNKGGGKDNRVQVIMRKDENGAFVVVGIRDIDETRNKNIDYNEEKESNEKEVTE